MVIRHRFTLTLKSEISIDIMTLATINRNESYDLKIVIQTGVNFTNVLVKALERVEPKSVKKTVKESRQSFLRFWDLPV